jgi:hypothetical protein
MDVNLIGDVARGRVYQGAAPDEGITSFQTAGRMLMLVEMAAGVNALDWVRKGNLRSVMYFGIDDAPDGCLDDPTLEALALSCRAWLRRGGDIIFGCAAGVSRSSYADCATLMVTLGIGFDDALAMIRKGRPIASPNSGFVAHLRKMEPRFLELAET